MVILTIIFIQITELCTFLFIFGGDIKVLARNWIKKDSWEAEKGMLKAFVLNLQSGRLIAGHFSQVGATRKRMPFGL